MTLILWFRTAEALESFIRQFLALESGVHLDVYSAISYKMATILTVTAFTSESGQIRFNVAGNGSAYYGITLPAEGVLRHELKLMDVE